MLRCLAVTCVLLVVLAAGARADWKPGQGMAASMAINLTLGKKITDDSSYGFHDTCYLGAFLQPGRNSWITTELEGGTSYIFAGAVASTCDLDIIVEDSSGRAVASDTKNDNIPVVRFAPRVSGTYTIRLSLYSGDAGYFCGMVLLRDGGWNLPAENLAQSAKQMLQRCSEVATQVPVRFHDEEGEWAVVGHVYREGETALFTDLRMGTGRRFLVTGADRHSRDTDLLFGEDGGGVLSSDVLDDNHPLLQFRTQRSQRYRMEVRNSNSGGATIIMTGLLAND